MTTKKTTPANIPVMKNKASEHLDQSYFQKNFISSLYIKRRNPIEKTYTSDTQNERIDVFLHKQNPEFSRNEIKKYFKDLHINQKSVKPAARLNKGDTLTCLYTPPPGKEIKAENIEIPIIYEDEYFIILNKPMDMPVHPSGNITSGTVVNFLLNYLPEPEKFEDKERAGIIHRLDKDTSGLLLTAKSPEALEKMQAQFKNRKVKKEYKALVQGIIKNGRGRIDRNIGRNPRNRKKMAVIEHGRNALTEYRVLKRYQSHTLVEARPVTGRTHQIRVHFQSIHHPICGDRLYTNDYHKYNIKGLCLCATGIDFLHPFLNKKMSFNIELPQEFEDILKGRL